MVCGSSACLFSLKWWTVFTTLKTNRYAHYIPLLTAPPPTAPRTPPPTPTPRYSDLHLYPGVGFARRQNVALRAVKSDGDYSQVSGAMLRHAKLNWVNRLRQAKLNWVNGLRQAKLNWDNGLKQAKLNWVNMLKQAKLNWVNRLRPAKLNWVKRLRQAIS